MTNQGNLEVKPLSLSLWMSQLVSDACPICEWGLPQTSQSLDEGQRDEGFVTHTGLCGITQQRCLVVALQLRGRSPLK